MPKTELSLSDFGFLWQCSMVLASRIFALINSSLRPPTFIYFIYLFSTKKKRLINVRERPCSVWGERDSGTYVEICSLPEKVERQQQQQQWRQWQRQQSTSYTKTKHYQNTSHQPLSKVHCEETKTQLLRMKLRHQWRHWCHFLNLAGASEFPQRKIIWWQRMTVWLDSPWLGAAILLFLLLFLTFFSHFSTLPLQAFVVLAEVKFWWNVGLRMSPDPPLTKQRAANWESLQVGCEI